MTTAKKSKTAAKSKPRSKPAPKSSKKPSKKISKVVKKSKSVKRKESDDEEITEIRLPGQKFSTPPLGDGTRTFYESTLQQIPSSKMAMKWCVEHGVLAPELQAKYAKKI